MICIRENCSHNGTDQDKEQFYLTQGRRRRACKTCVLADAKARHADRMIKRAIDNMKAQQIKPKQDEVMRLAVSGRW
ncbi:MAG: hypothetical protein RPU52_02415 [Candidatus Sedimenticola sp. (ex Thyasira tokunagai)]